MTGGNQAEVQGSSPLYLWAAGASTSGSQDAQPLFVRTRSGGNFWFNTELKQSEAHKDEYRWAGWLMGQCFANRTMLCIPLPELLFVKLLKGSSFQVCTCNRGHI